MPGMRGPRSDSPSSGRSLCRRKPERTKRFFRRGLARELLADVEIDVHFKPHYEPWDQRLCLVPDGDLFRSLLSRACLGGHRRGGDVHPAGDAA